MAATIAKVKKINIALLKQKTWAVLDNMQDNDHKIKTGRIVRMGHFLAIQQLIELMYIDQKNGGLIDGELITNRGNLAHAFKCGERSVYNYIVDFESLGFITSKCEKTANGFIIVLSFNLQVIHTNTCGEQKSDTPPPPHVCGIGKLCRIHNSKELNNNNINNNTLEGVEKIESKTREAANIANSAWYSVHESLSKDPQEHMQLTQNANALWDQAKKTLYQGQKFRGEVQQEVVQLLALALVNQSAIYKQKRKEAIKNYCSHPGYIASSEKKQYKMLKRFNSKLEQDLRQPLRAAYRDINRALQIQLDNTIKNNYSCYYPTIYFSQYFDKALSFAMKEKRTMQAYQQQNKKRRAHAQAKQMVVQYADKAVNNLHQYGFKYAKDQLRRDYMNFHNFLVDTALSNEAKKTYLERFLKQTIFVISKQ